MKCWQLMFGICCYGVLAVTSSIEADGVICTTDYIKNITCVWNMTGIPVKSNKSNYSLTFVGRSNASCPVVVTNGSYRCDCKVNNIDIPWADFDEYNIKLCSESHCGPLKSTFALYKNIQLKPPPELVVQETTEAVHITFESPYNKHRYLQNRLDYQILMQTPQFANFKLITVSWPNNMTLISRSKLLNREYCFKARYLPETYYGGTWSEWSKPACWKNQAEEEQESVLFILAKSLVPVCVAVAVLLFLFYSPTARMKIKTLSHTPSPAPFFQPLYKQHKGNLQEWLSPKGKRVLTDKVDEIISDAVTVVPKPITKDPEESQAFLNPPVIQLEFPLCQTSYVGLPGMDKAPPTIAIMCPANTSYTQLPCSIWEVDTGEVQAVSSPPEDILELSCADSGCSFEDVTHSPECSLPTSPVDGTPAPCYCSDYCILNKTAEGVVPVLLSKESRVKAPAESQQEAQT